MRPLIVAIVVVPLAFGSGSVRAQNPSANDIINQLRPSPTMMPGSGTRGLNFVAPSKDAPPPPPPAASAQQPHVASNRPAPVSPVPSAAPAVSLTVNFASGSAELTPDAIRTLDDLGRALASNDLAAYRFRIEGHTDTLGSSSYNRTLSKRRADAVVDYVAKRFGVDPSRLEAVGMGEDGLLVPTPPQTAEPRNRRVQVINISA